VSYLANSTGFLLCMKTTSLLSGKLRHAGSLLVETQVLPVELFRPLLH